MLFPRAGSSVARVVLSRPTLQVPRQASVQLIRAYSSQHLLQQAHKALAASNYDGAKSLFRELSRQPDATVDALYNLGVVEWLTKQPEAAVICWQEALKKPSEDKVTQSDCHTNLANYYLLARPDLKKAIEHLKAASELAPEDGEIKHNYGLALEKDGQIELALENYLRAEELGVQKDIETLIRNAGAKLIKRNSELPATQEELEAMQQQQQQDDDEAPMATQVDYGPSGNGR